MEDKIDRAEEMSQLSVREVTPGRVTDDGNHPEHQNREGDSLEKSDNDNFSVSLNESEILTAGREPGSGNGEGCDIYVDDFVTNKQTVERRMPNAVLPLLRYYQYESSDSSPSFQGSPSEDRHFRSDVDDTETEEASFSGQEESADHTDILEWAKENNHGSLQIICEYYHLRIPARGSTLRFHPLEHLHPLEYHRPDETALHTAGSTIDLRSCGRSLELAEVRLSYFRMAWGDNKFGRSYFRGEGAF